MRTLLFLTKIRVYLTHVKELTQPLICNRFKKMVDGQSRNIGNRNKLHMPYGQRPRAVRPWNDFAESLGNIENLEQLKAEVKKRFFPYFIFHIL